jgi:hypothetical protein
LASRSAAEVFMEQCPAFPDISHKVLSKEYKERKVSGRE